MKYRADIDGLRAVAVISVVLFHAFPNVLPGGFIGVDVFFVISGYLITSILAHEVRQGSFSLLNFYERRIRRLIPPLIPVLSFVVAATIFTFPPAQLREVTESIYATVFFFANWHFFSEAGYFDGPAHMKPLLHMWSLGVEEQYYLIIPFVVSLLALRGRWLVRTLITLVLISLAHSTYASFYEPNYAFYSTLSRFWELGAGSLLALAPRGTNLSKNTATTVGVFAIAALAFSFVFVGSDSTLPSPGAIGCVLATVSLILIGGRPDNAITRVLSLGPVVYVGKISYALYIWHWPLLVFAKFSFYNNQDIAILCALLLSAGLSVVSLHLIETPIRRRRFLPKKWQMGALLATFCGAFVALGSWSPQAQRPTVEVSASLNQYNKSLSNARSVWQKRAEKDRCWVDHRVELSSVINVCLQTDPSQKNVLVIGDSHAAHLMPGLRANFPSTTFSLLAVDSCNLTRKNMGLDRKACFELLDFVEKPENLANFDVIVVSVRLTNFLSVRLTNIELVSQYVEAVESLAKKSEAKIVVFGPIQFYDPNLPTLYPLLLNQEKDEISRRLDSALVLERFEINDLLDESFRNDKNIQYIPLIQMHCPTGASSCKHFSSDGMPILLDNSHLTPLASAELMQQLARFGYVDMLGNVANFDAQQLYASWLDADIQSEFERFSSNPEALKLLAFWTPDGRNVIINTNGDDRASLVIRDASAERIGVHESNEIPVHEKNVLTIRFDYYLKGEHPQVSLMRVMFEGIDDHYEYVLSADKISPSQNIAKNLIQTTVNNSAGRRVNLEIEIPGNASSARVSFVPAYGEPPFAPSKSIVGDLIVSSFRVE